MSKRNKKILVVVALCLMATANVGALAFKGILQERGMAVSAAVLFPSAFTIGLSVILFSYPEDAARFSYRVLRPWLFVVIATIISFIVVYLGVVAVIFLPALLALGSAGGLVGGRIRSK